MTEQQHTPDASLLSACVTGWRLMSEVEGWKWEDRTVLLAASPFYTFKDNVLHYHYEVLRIRTVGDFLKVLDAGGEVWQYDLCDVDWFVVLSGNPPVPPEERQND